MDHKNQKRIRLLKYEEVLEKEEHNFKILRTENSALWRILKIN